MLRLLYQFPTWIQHLYTKVTWRRDVASKIVFLTFDDGPIPEVTPQVLDILAAYGVKATFFCVGDNLRKHPDIFQRIIREGHAVGNHTYNHLPGWQTPTKDYLSNVEQTNQLLQEHGITTRLFRPPYGRMRQKQKNAISKTHEIILWDVLTHDYNQRSFTPEKILQVVKRYTRPGSIINFHDSLKSEYNVTQSLPTVIEWLLAEGYKIELLMDN